MDITMILQRMTDIFSAIMSNPLVYLPLIGSWIITTLYFIINHDEKVGHTYVMSTGVAHIFTAYMISPFALPEIQWSFSDMRTIVVAILFGYGVFLTLLAIMKAFPDFLAEFFGDPSHAIVPSMMAVLYVESSIPFDWITFAVIVVPVTIVAIIRYSRKFGR